MAANTKTGKKRIASKQRVTGRKLDCLMDFSDVLFYLKEIPNARFMRRGWNGKGMFIFLVPGSSFKVNRPPLDVIYKKGTVIRYHPHIDMKTADGQIVPWLASQTDLLADDWMRVI